MATATIDTPAAPTPEPVRMNNTLKAVITVAALAFNAGIIALLVWRGEGANSLHGSALAWSYIMGGGILIGLGIGTISQPLLDAFQPRR